MKKTLLLCFIHGFKGGDDTFGAKSEFALHLEAVLAAELPKIDVRAITYPKYETRGDLFECVARFRDWLLEKVIDMEVANGTPSPTVDPSVRVILIGHSMGGIVAAETAIGLSREKVIKPQPPPPQSEEEGTTTEKEEHDLKDDGAKVEAEEGGNKEDKDTVERDDDDDEAETEFSGLMFPYVQGVLAFDTPYLGISPGVVAHGAEGHYNTATAALTQLSGLSSMIWGNSNSSSSSSSNQHPQSNSNTSSSKPPAALLAPPPPPGTPKSNWGKIAMVAGAAGALAAGGAAAYLKRGEIGSGWSWVGSHLEFVGCLARGEELRRRVRDLTRLEKELGVGFANLYTRLGRAAGDLKQQQQTQGGKGKGFNLVGTVLGRDRTFCNLPGAGARSRHGSKAAAAATVGIWREAVNDKARDEVGAHMAMFEPDANPGYHQLSDDAKNLIVGWAKNDWYESSTSRDLLDE
ncbi:hypothetical protein F4778DRAFT_92794 [Xylariomycetidae sp. FL2044]|nr:hypothetical protein F4778DRAFT_92794 [Xylariomycetidae sp. FL2044]